MLTALAIISTIILFIYILGVIKVLSYYTGDRRGVYYRMIIVFIFLGAVIWLLYLK